MADPHNTDLDRILQDFFDEGLIEVRGERNGSPVYVLTPKGRRFCEAINASGDDLSRLVARPSLPLPVKGYEA
jgi:predicted transcriptional regulator